LEVKNLEEREIDPITEFWLRFMVAYYTRSTLGFLFPELLGTIVSTVKRAYREE